MDDKRSDVTTSTGLGVGYVSLMMLFAVICLTVLSVLSYQAAGSNEILNERSSSFNSEYYRADGRAKSILMQLDKTALECHNSGFFADSFADECSAFSDVTVTPVAEGFRVEYSETINDRLLLDVEIVFFSSPQGDRYRIDSWKTLPTDLDEQDSSLGVWDGSTI